MPLVPCTLSAEHANIALTPTSSGWVLGFAKAGPPVWDFHGREC